MKPRPQLDENVTMARFANLLWHYTGKQNYRSMAQHAMKYLATPDIALSRKYFVGGILLADQEMSAPPLHITIVGAKNDPIAAALFTTATTYPMAYKRVEWWDRREGPLPNTDVEYPNLKVSAAFICTANSCSSPVFKTDDLRARIDKFLKRDTPRP